MTSSTLWSPKPGQPAFVLDNYGRFLSVFFGSVIGFSLFLAGLVAAICVAIGLPWTVLAGGIMGATLLAVAAGALPAQRAARLPARQAMGDA